MGDNRIELAAFISTGEPERLYTGLSVLVSAVAEGRRCAALVSFRALGTLLEGELDADPVGGSDGKPGGESGAKPESGSPASGALPISTAARYGFVRSLKELIETARELERLKLYACSASVDLMTIPEKAIEGKLDGVMSTPRFLREAEGAQILFV